MPWLTEAKLYELKGQSRCERLATVDGVLDATRIPAALASANATARGYLARVGPDPLPEGPAGLDDALIEKTAHLTLYALGGGVEMLEQSIRDFRDDAVSWFKRVAAGEVSVTWPDAPALSDNRPAILMNKTTADFKFAGGGLDAWK